MGKKRTCCSKCGVELSFKELVVLGTICYTCERTQHDKRGVEKGKTIEE